MVPAGEVQQLFTNFFFPVVWLHWVATEPGNQGSEGKAREKNLVRDVREKSVILK
jgi:hypothetical protein